jgi:hypothetical protein
LVVRARERPAVPDQLAQLKVIADRILAKVDPGKPC